MKVCIVGAGSVGGLIGARLARVGAEVCLVARGAHLDAIRERGLTLEADGERQTLRLAASNDPASFAQQDVVIVAVKAPALAEILPRLAPLLSSDTTVLTAMNGLPWWFFDGFDHPFGGARPGCIDPGGRLAAALDLDRIVGCVIHLAASVPVPGVIRHAAADHLIVGEPDGSESQRVAALAEALRHAGFRCDISATIRQDYWIKLLGNFNFGPVSALTGATNAGMTGDPALRALLTATMEEAVRVGEAFGLAPGMSVAERIDLGGSLGAFKTSMLQDLEKHRPMEIDSIVRVVIEMARIAGVATPLSDAMIALLAMRARSQGLYPTP